MEIIIYNRTNLSIDAYKRLFKEIGEVTTKTFSLPNDMSVSVTFVRSRTMHQMNLEYRGIDKPTDVLSFAMQEGKSYAKEEEKDLGDIIINMDYAKRQAKEYDHYLKREVGFLFTHGLLHCLGYDHQTKKQEKEMIQKQKEILDPIIK